MKYILTIAIAMLSSLMSLSANATLITLQSALVGPWGPTTMQMSYEDSTPDSNADPLRGSYVGALRSLDVNVRGNSYSLDTMGENTIFTYGGLGAIAGPANVKSFFNMIDSNGVIFSADIRIEAYPVPLSDQLSEIPNLRFVDSCFLDLYRPDGTIFLTFPGNGSFAAVPEPSTLGLLVPLVLLLVLVRLTKRRDLSPVGLPWCWTCIHASWWAGRCRNA